MGHCPCFFINIRSIYLTGLSTSLRQLTEKAFNRAKTGLQPSTNKSYTTKFRLFIAFCVYHKVQLLSISSTVLLAFLEFLVSQKFTYASVLNHLSAIRTLLPLHNIPNQACFHKTISLFMAALKQARPYRTPLRPIITIPILHNIITHTALSHCAFVFKAAYLLAFFSFLRISNLVPHAAHQFDHTKHLCPGDIIFAPPGAHIVIKWSKTMQARDKAKVVQIPAISDSPLCPIRALKQLLRLTPGHKNSPLFQILAQGKWVPLTDSILRKNLTSILRLLQLHKSGITFHTFRRSGASLAFQLNVDIQQIQSHGLWTSECVWRYIIRDSQTTNQVALSFQNLLATPTTTS